jgi:hypothetical protein
MLTKILQKPTHPTLTSKPDPGQTPLEQATPQLVAVFTILMRKRVRKATTLVPWLITCAKLGGPLVVTNSNSKAMMTTMIILTSKRKNDV